MKDNDKRNCGESLKEEIINVLLIAKRAFKENYRE